MRAPQKRLILYLNVAHFLSTNFIESDILKCDSQIFCNYARFKTETAHCVVPAPKMVGIDKAKIWTGLCGAVFLKCRLKVF